MGVVSSVSDVVPAVIDDLRELVEALDRRVPRLERAGETEIACDAAHLRDEALRRLAMIESRR
jgi:4-hydroxy-3-methylbut-2-enyl diphosphate reductase IspH